MPNLPNGRITDKKIQHPAARRVSFLGYLHSPSTQSTPISTFSVSPAFAMIGISVWDYIFIRACIFLLHLVAPVSVAYSVVSWLLHLPFHVPRVLEVWLALEAAFYLLFYLPRRNYLQKIATHPPVGRDDRRKLLWRCHSNIPNPHQYLTRWFRDAPIVEIRRENVREFFRWAFPNPIQPDPAYDEEMEEYIEDMEKLLGRKLEPGRGSAKCLRLSLDKVEMLHRSLTWYMVRLGGELHIELLAWITIQSGLLTSLYSVYLLSIRWHLFTCATTPSTSTARHFSDPSPYSP